MESDLPRITIVTPSFNQAQFLERTIRSVLDQEYPDLEYLVMDGGSTDGSVEIIRRFAERLTYWTSGPDGGQAAAINAGWRMAHGEVLAWLNSDDVFLPGALSAVGHAFQEHPKAVLVYGQTQLVDPDGLLLGTVGSAYRQRTLLYSHQLIPQPSSFFRRSAVEAVGLLDECSSKRSRRRRSTRRRRRPAIAPLRLPRRIVSGDATCVASARCWFECNQVFRGSSAECRTGCGAQ